MKRTTQIGLGVSAGLALFGILSFGLWERAGTLSTDHPLEEPVPRFESFSFEEYRNPAESASVSSKTIPPTPAPTLQKETGSPPQLPTPLRPQPALVQSGPPAAVRSAQAPPHPPYSDPGNQQLLGPRHWLANAAPSGSSAATTDTPGQRAQVEIDQQLDALLPERQAAREHERLVVEAYTQLRREVAGRITACVQEHGPAQAEGEAFGALSAWLERGRLGQVEMRLVSWVEGEPLEACLRAQLERVRGAGVLGEERRWLEFGVSL